MARYHVEYDVEGDELHSTHWAVRPPGTFDTSNVRIERLPEPILQRFICERSVSPAVGERTRPELVQMVLEDPQAGIVGAWRVTEVTE